MKYLRKLRCNLYENLWGQNDSKFTEHSSKFLKATLWMSFTSPNSFNKFILSNPFKL